MNSKEAWSCLFCGSHQLIARRYLRLDSSSLLRNLAYVIPPLVARLLSFISERFAVAYRPVMVNRRYFIDKDAVYCRVCATGRAVPEFSAEDLSLYYREFYWQNRDIADGQHISADNKPNEQQRALTRDRISWIRRHVGEFRSVIDFGAGDCSATYELMSSGAIVHVVDPSFKAGELARNYGATHTESLSGAPVVDLLYSAHSIEHVASLLESIAEMLDHTKVGGCVFFETPNIGDAAVFLGLSYTPHTFMLSGKTFDMLESRLPLKVLAVESCGPEWSVGHPAIRSSERTDLRVLLRKDGDLISGAYR